MLIKEKLKSVTLQTSVDTLDDVICEYKRELIIFMFLSIRIYNGRNHMDKHLPKIDDIKHRVKELIIIYIEKLFLKRAQF